MFIIRRSLLINPAFSWRGFCSPPINNKLFVGGLSWSVDEKSLKDAFSSYGEVTEVRIMYDKDTGRTRGFGFVHFSKADEAQCAKDAMDGKAFLGRPLRISFALDKVRGASVVVPRFSSVGDAAERDN
ncbi:RNA recognition motif domain [Dillenia turbinata]|uniref:RNA recognition motif domain n=1 Tax=Dillenia turbinata TaxID=194707 RepID=A0AAN8UNE2_9MAGN